MEEKEVEGETDKVPLVEALQPSPTKIIFIHFLA